MGLHGSISPAPAPFDGEFELGMPGILSTTGGVRVGRGYEQEGDTDPPEKKKTDKTRVEDEEGAWPRGGGSAACEMYAE